MDMKTRGQKKKWTHIIFHLCSPPWCGDLWGFLWAQEAGWVKVRTASWRAPQSEQGMAQKDACGLHPGCRWSSCIIMALTRWGSVPEPMCHTCIPLVRRKIIMMAWARHIALRGRASPYHCLHRFTFSLPKNRVNSVGRESELGNEAVNWTGIEYKLCIHWEIIGFLCWNHCSLDGLS